MKSVRSLLLPGLLGGMVLPALASKSDPVPVRLPEEVVGWQELYQTLKEDGQAAPAWLEEALFGPPAPSGEASREGGETVENALAIPSLPFTDAGNTSDNVDNYGTGAWSYPLQCVGGNASASMGRAKDVVYALTLESASRVSVDLCASSFDTVLGVFANNGGALGACLAGSDDNCSINAQVECLLAAGSYFILVDGFSSVSEGAYVLSVTLPQPVQECASGFNDVQEEEPLCASQNDACGLAQMLPLDTGLCGTTWGDNQQRDVDWFAVPLEAAGQLTLTAQAPAFPLEVRLFNACGGTELERLLIPQYAQDQRTSACLAPGMYWVAVSSYLYTDHPCQDNNHYGLKVSATGCQLPCDAYTCQPLSHGSVSGNNTGKPNLAGHPSGDDFYCFVATTNCHAVFSLCDPGTSMQPGNDSYLRLWSAGGPCLGGVQLATDDDSCVEPPMAAELEYDLLAGQPYVLQVEGYASNAGPYVLHADMPCVEVDAAETPAEFALSPNSPNPFNPLTTLSFTLPETSSARLVVYDVAGRQVAVLVDGPRSRGSHQVAFDGHALASGVYLAVLTADGRESSRKMLLVK